MKIKRFDNLWAMGLILFGVLLLSFYILKIFFPDFIVGVAELPSIVEFGNYVDNHKWAYYLFYGVTSFISMYLFGCACFSIKKLKAAECLFLIGLFIVSSLIEAFLPTQSFTFNVCGYFIFVLFIAFYRKIGNYKVLYSTVICYLITAFSQSISLEIRGISTLVTYPNTATFFILLIDGYIWSLLLYLFFNYKGGLKMGKLGFPWYGEDFANAIETAKTIIAKIESNKYDEKDVKELTEVNAEIIKYATKNED